MAVLAASSTALAKDNWLGTWKINVAKSKFGPGPAPQSQTTTFEAVADGSIKLTSDGVNADGKAMHTEYVSKFDGQDVPWTGNPNADTAAPKRIDANATRTPYEEGRQGLVTDGPGVVRSSADGKTARTLTQTRHSAPAPGEEDGEQHASCTRARHVSDGSPRTGSSGSW